MGLINLIKKMFWFEALASLFVFMIIIELPSCKNDGSNASQNCFDYCDPEKPDSAYITIKVTINGQNPYVPVVLYRDKFNPDKQLVIERVDTARVENFMLRVSVNQYYSVEAKYISGNKIIYAVDGSIFDTYKQEGCDNTCWRVAGGPLDVRLKF